MGRVSIDVVLTPGIPSVVFVFVALTHALEFLRPWYSERGSRSGHQEYVNLETAQHSVSHVFLCFLRSFSTQNTQPHHIVANAVPASLCVMQFQHFL